MFQKCHRLFCLNTLNSSSRTFSCWLNPTTTYAAGRQFLQTKPGNGYQFPCNIPFKPKELCHHNQYYNGNFGDYHPLPVKKANSPNIRSAPKIPTNNNNWFKQQNEQQYSERAAEKHFEVIENRFLQLSNYNNEKNLSLRLEKSKMKQQKLFHLALFVSGRLINFENILVPQDAYEFVRAMDELIWELAAEDFEQKFFNIKAPQQSMAVGAQHQLKRELKLRNVVFTGFIHQFQLELVLFINSDNRGKMEKQICLRLLSVHKIHAKDRTLTLPLQALPWLRNQMAEMLALHDGTEQIALEAPAQIPQQFFR